MAIVLWLFLLLTSLYHVLVTVLVYGIGIAQPETIVVLREGVRFLLLIITAIVQRKHIIPYLKRTRKLRLVFLVICALAIGVSYRQ